jgi:hypothetical protein
MLSFHSDWPQAMVNWRALILDLRPGSGERFGFVVSSFLGIVTMVSALLVWRGGWHADRSDFPAKTTLLLIATLLSSHHSHAYGATLLALPLAATLGTAYASPAFRTIVLVAAFVPTVMLCADYPIALTKTGLFARIPPAAMITSVGLIAAYLVLLRTLLKATAVSREVLSATALSQRVWDRPA